ncbi:hypothetical protein [Acetivibrio clariflavus]|uniref:hypothetical protein n=1 Tax=Acetivibrio clariflavus TaxID=288965 RepID=UPI000481F033|nr:hypothetical protein [Acetivibrio clariflavus]
MKRDQKYDLKILEKDIQKTIKKQGALKGLKMISNCFIIKWKTFLLMQFVLFNSVMRDMN